MGGDKLGGVREKREKKGVVLRQPYLFRPPLDQAEFWICWAAHYCLASHRRDCNYLPPFEKPDHLKISGNPLKPVGVAGQFLHRPPLDVSDFLVSCISLYYLHDDRRDFKYLLPFEGYCILNEFWNLLRLFSNVLRRRLSLEFSYRWIKLIFEYCVCLGCYYIFTEGILLVCLRYR